MTSARWSIAVALAVITAVTAAAAVLANGMAVAATILAGVGAALTAVLVSAGRAVQPEEPQSEPRCLPGNQGYPAALAEGSRRRFLGLGVAIAAAIAATAAAVPVWSATRRAERRLRETLWRPGVRLVDDNDQPIHADDLPVGGFATAWPEGHRGEDRTQAVLIRLDGDRRLSAPGRSEWLADGHVAYSKLCTHMGCPVGLYQSRAELLVCPCHQATFDVLRGAKPIHGPAHRPLPQLPLAVDAQGYLVAADDFPEPVGPSYWSRPR